MKVVSTSLSTWRGLIFIVLAATLPIIFTMLWLIKNKELPTSDATDYLTTAFQNYSYFTEQGFWKNILHFELIRGWRPIFFPILIVPFFLISKGNAYFAYHAVALICIAASATYIYLWFRLKLDRLSAIIATNLICLLPFIQNQALAFFSEAALFPCLFGCTYHLIRSDYLRNKAHIIGFISLFSLALLIRPVEVGIHAFFVLTFFLLSGLRLRIFSVQQIFITAAMGLFVLFLFFFFVTAHFLDHYPIQIIDSYFDKLLAKTLYHALIATLLGTSLVVVLGVIINKFLNSRFALENKNPKAPLVIVFAIPFFITMLWYFPYAFKTFLWIYRTSIGDIAKYSATWMTESWWQGLYSFIMQEGKMVVFGVIAIALFGFLSFSKQQKKDVLFATPFIYLLLLLPIPFWEVLFTVQSTARKLTIAFPAFLMAMLLLALQRGRGWAIRLGCVAIILITQFLFAIQLISPENPPSYFTTLMGNYRKPVIIQPNPHDVVLSFLSEQEKKYHFKKLVIGVYPDENETSIDPFLMSMLSILAQQPYTVYYPYYSSFSTDAPIKLSETRDAIFLSKRLTDMVISEETAKNYAKKMTIEKNPSIKTLYQILFYYSKNTLDQIGWTLGPCLIFTSAKNQNYRGCLLFSNKSINIHQTDRIEKI